VPTKTYVSCLTSLEYPAAGPREEEAYSLLREIVTLAKNNQGYQRKLADLKALLPEAPQIKQVILDWFARQ